MVDRPPPLPTLGRDPSRDQLADAVGVLAAHIAYQADTVRRLGLVAEALVPLIAGRRRG